MSTRYRCRACGNLTRFDVVAQRRTRSFHHYSIGGELQVEDEVVLDETVEEVSCRWCGTGASVEPVEPTESVEVDVLETSEDLASVDAQGTRPEAS